MGVEHKLDDGPLQSGYRAIQDYKTRPGNFCAQFKVNQPIFCAQINVIFRCKPKIRQHTPTADFDIGIFIFAVGDSFIQDIGDGFQHASYRLLDIGQFRFRRFQFIAQMLDLIHQRLDIFAFGLSLADGFRAAIALVLQFLGLDLDVLTARFQRQVRCGVKNETASVELLDNLIKVCPE
jgi:hypothetical protein